MVAAMAMVLAGQLIAMAEEVIGQGLICIRGNLHTPPTANVTEHP